MTDEDLKKEIWQKKDFILKAFRNKLTYDKWDKRSSIWVYDFFEITEITDKNHIRILLFEKPCNVCCFSNKEDAETYKWLMDIMTEEIDRRVVIHFQEFVDYKDLAIGDKNIFYVKDEKYEQR